MKRNHGQDERAPWGRFIGLLVAFLLILVGNISASALTPPPGSAAAIHSTPPLTLSIASVTSPTSNCLLTSASAVLAVTVHDVGGTVMKVDFYNGSTLLGTATTAPYSFTWANPPQGVQTLTARAYDNYGYNIASAPMSATVFTSCMPDPAPQVHITSPASNAVLSPPVTIQASANELFAPGSSPIARVAFYDGQQLLGTATTAPYTFTWSNPAAGPHTLSARVYDQAGRDGTSSPVPVSLPASAHASAPTATPTHTSAPAPTPTHTSAPAPTPTHTPVPTPTPTQGHMSCEVSYQLASQWSGGFSITLIISNTGSISINGWTLQFSFPGNQQITDLWSGNLTQSGEQVTITNESWNGGIAPGNAVNLGFNGTWSGSNANPTTFTLNGQICAVA